jgi:hypothetical protein
MNWSAVSSWRCETTQGSPKSTLMFIEALRINLHVKSLSFQCVELENDFFVCIGGKPGDQLCGRGIDLSTNCFTNEGLANFCQSVTTNNEYLKRLNLQNQTTPISIASEEDVLEAFRENKSFLHVQLEFQSEDRIDPSTITSSEP